MCNATQLFAEGVEGPRPGGREPDIGDQARHHIHLRAELWHREVVQYIYRAEFQLDRLPYGKMQLRARYQDVVLPVRIVRIHTERIFIADVPGIDGAQSTVLPGEAIVEVPLPSHDLQHRRVLRDFDELRPCEQSGGQHGDDSHRGPQDKRAFQLFALGFVVRLYSLAVTVAQHAISHEQIDDDEYKPRDPERDRYGLIDRVPIGGDRREI